MRFFVLVSMLSFITLLGFEPVVRASQNLNHISCLYTFDGTDWVFWSSQSSVMPFNLTSGQTKVLNTAWTQDKPAGGNFAFCTSMTGTSSDDSVTVTRSTYQAELFQAPVGGTSCGFTGKNVKLVSEEPGTVLRGSFAELEMEWVPPRAEKLRVREYFPLESEIPNLDQIRAAKCAQLKP
jgi:hypothetical protein